MPHRHDILIKPVPGVTTPIFRIILRISIDLIWLLTCNVARIIIIHYLFVGQRRTGTPTEPGFSQGFFLHSGPEGVLVPCHRRLWLLACSVGDTKISTILLICPHWHYMIIEMSWMTSPFSPERLYSRIKFCCIIFLLPLWSCFETICIVKSAI